MSTDTRAPGLFTRIVSRAIGSETPSAVGTSIRPVLPYAFDPLPEDFDAQTLRGDFAGHEGVRDDFMSENVAVTPPMMASGVTRVAKNADANTMVSAHALADSRSHSVRGTLDRAVEHARYDSDSLYREPEQTASDSLPERSSASRLQNRRDQSAELSPPSPGSEFRDLTESVPAPRRNFPGAAPESAGPATDSAPPLRRRETSREELTDPARATISRSLRSRAAQAGIPPPPPSAHSETPTIEIHIGRIEVRAPSAPSATSSAGPHSTHSAPDRLTAHLRARTRGSRS